jgi:hypothetical protein
LTPRDNQRFESLAKSILDLDTNILSISIVGIRNGSTIVEMVKTEFKQNFGAISQRSNGMAGRWGILAFNSMERLEPVKSKAKYLVMVREDYNGLIFPANILEEVMISLIIDSKAEAAGIYQKVLSSLTEDSRSIISA